MNEPKQIEVGDLLFETFEEYQYPFRRASGFSLSSKPEPPAWRWHCKAANGARLANPLTARGTRKDR